MSLKTFCLLHKHFPAHLLVASSVSAFLPFCLGIPATAASASPIPEFTPLDPTGESLLSPPYDPENFGHGLWKRPPAHCLWEITFHFAPEPSTPTPVPVPAETPRKVTFLQHGRESFARLETQGGRCFEFWNLQNAEIDDIQGQLRVRAERPSKQGRPPNRPPDAQHQAENPPSIWQEDWLSLKGFHWVLPEFLRGVHSLGSESYHVFVSAPAELSDRNNTATRAERSPLAGLPLLQGVNAAAIHQKSMLPAMLQRGTEVRTYKFTPLPARKLEIPARISVFLENLMARKSFTPRPMP
ncbi:MAG: hypothetical protein EBS01_09010 [Verrucomicrobia bacterium]|nr:hypothetical protein [Verrucomicrobiota bacterium]